MLTPNFFIDLVPVVLAGIGLYQLQLAEIKSPRLYLAAVSAILLIVCQSSWIFSYVIDKPMVTSSIDFLWTLFNACVMCLAILTIRDHHV